MNTQILLARELPPEIVPDQAPGRPAAPFPRCPNPLGVNSLETTCLYQKSFSLLAIRVGWAVGVLQWLLVRFDARSQCRVPRAVGSPQHCALFAITPFAPSTLSLATRPALNATVPNLWGGKLGFSQGFKKDDNHYQILQLINNPPAMGLICDFWTVCQPEFLGLHWLLFALAQTPSTSQLLAQNKFPSPTLLGL